MSRSSQAKLFNAIEELSHIKDFYIESERRNEDALLELEKKFQKATEGKSEEYKQEYFDYKGLEFYYYEKIYPQLIRKTVFLQIYFTLENYMKILCDVAQERRSLTVSYKDLHGQGIRKAENYFTKVCNITEPFNSSNWESIMAYNELRNVIAHNLSILNEKLKVPLHDLIISNNDKGEMIFQLEKEFIPSCINIVEEFLLQFRDI
ncbi:hypothetical protein [Bacillus altitudinis]|uniref:hypothetical protein n=1 Tax=Bacillus altitudinis TaxID=293387 RepID=UPI0011A10694|nr:hypothetical protein [Bacillus altitudinis]